MIKTIKVICLDTFKYNKSDFYKGKEYKGYIGKAGTIIINDRKRVLFYDHLPGELKWGDKTKGFKRNFTVIDEDYVSNKPMLNKFVNE